MRKNILRELTLPAFWVFFFIASSKKEEKVEQLKKADKTELKKQDITVSDATKSKNKNKQSVSAKAIYLSEY